MTSRYDFSPELRLLLAGARTMLTDDARAVLRDSASREVNWAYVLQLAAGHAVLPVVAKHVLEHSRHAMSASILQAWTDEAYKRQMECLFGTQEMGRLCTALADAGVRVIAYKGAVLGQMAYGDPRLRWFSDLDLLISPGDFETTYRVLEANEYKSKQRMQKLSGQRLSLFLHLEREYGFRHVNDLFSVDLHTGVGPLRFFPTSDFDSFWEQGLTVEVGGTPVRTFALPDQLRMLSYHGAKHRWIGLKFVCDIAEFVQAFPELNWDAVYQGVDQTGNRRGLHLALRLAQELLDLHLPDEIARRVPRDTSAERMAMAAAARIVRSKRDEAGYFERLAFHLGLQDRVGGKMRYIANALMLNTWNRRLMNV